MEEKRIQPAAPKPHLYSEEDVRGILKQAVGLQTKSFTREQLEEMADELGITSELLEIAEGAWFKEGKELKVRDEFISYRQERSRKNWVILSIVLCLTMMMTLITIWSDVICLAFAGIFITMMLIFVGLGEAHHAYEAYFVLEGDEFEEKFDSWLDKQKQRQLRLEERREKFGP